jgi:hypothetical protein
VSTGVSACGLVAAGVFAGHAELAPWLCLSSRRYRVRASGLAGVKDRRSPAAGQCRVVKPDRRVSMTWWRLVGYGPGASVGKGGTYRPGPVLVRPPSRAIRRAG